PSLSVYYKACFFQAEDGIRDRNVTGVQTCALPISVIGESIAAGISAVVHVFFWVTLVFAILERSGADAGARWDVDQLPEPQSTGVGRVDAIASVIFGILAVAVILWDQ